MLLKNIGLIDAFDEHRQMWLDMAQDAYNYTAQTVSNAPRKDDVAPHLGLALEANPEFVDLKTENKAIARYWFRHFADLILDRVWDELAVEEG